MDETSPLLYNQSREGSDLLSPNLRPRHQELIPTPCGPIKRWSELSCPLKSYFCLTVASLLALLGLTVSSVYKQHTGTAASDEDNLTVSLIQLIGILFCVYYISRGVLQDNRQELVKFVLSVLVVMLRSLVNFCVLDSEDRMKLLLCLCVLVTTWDSTLSTRNGVLLGVGVVWACLTAAVGAAAVLKESKVLVWIFMTLNLPQVAFFVFLVYTLVVQWQEDTSYTLEAAAVTGGVVSLLIKVLLLWSLVRLVRSFGQGLRERMFAGSQ
ncbi:uncharacterized protein [Nerophis lumbriciformis]|uniref:uncharacterized protein isoform X3 n=1 Tax=Nerophis lumbriciformis TaxID=546530 RepID=UPI002AE061CA|nr:uncharacterized protein LOC133616028 isoform X3 [Nerophis lumbriciformis]